MDRGWSKSMSRTGTKSSVPTKRTVSWPRSQPIIRWFASMRPSSRTARMVARSCGQDLVDALGLLGDRRVQAVGARRRHRTRRGPSRRCGRARHRRRRSSRGRAWSADRRARPGRRSRRCRSCRAVEEAVVGVGDLVVARQEVCAGAPPQPSQRVAHVVQPARCAQRVASAWPRRLLCDVRDRDRHRQAE